MHLERSRWWNGLSLYPRQQSRGRRGHSARPEFLVYAPKDGPRKDGEARRRLAAFDYFIPYSPKWPGPDDPNFERAPRLKDFPTMSDLPDIAFAPSRFGGWMFHIWLWEHNPGGMFTNWNTSVPRCEGSAF
jgi:hypothetical protein